MSQDNKPQVIRWQLALALCGLLILWANMAIGGQAEDQALIHSAITGSLKEVEYLLRQGADVNARDNGGMTVLMFASAAGHKQIVRVLLDNDDIPVILLKKSNTIEPHQYSSGLIPTRKCTPPERLKLNEPLVLSCTRHVGYCPCFLPGPAQTLFR